MLPELSLADIAEIRQKAPAELELEAFVHGAMCMSVSGRCLLSQHLTGGTRTAASAPSPCRWKYYLMEESRSKGLWRWGEGGAAAIF